MNIYKAKEGAGHFGLRTAVNQKPHLKKALIQVMFMR